MNKAPLSHSDNLHSPHNDRKNVQKNTGLSNEGLWKKIAYYLFLGFVFLFPLTISTSSTEIAFYGAAGILLTLFVTKRVGFTYRSPLILPLLAFGLWAVIGLFTALDMAYSFHDLKSHFVKHLLLYLLVINLIDTPKKLRQLSWTLIISSGMFCMGSLIHEYLILNISPSTRFGLKLIETPTNLIGVVTLFALVLAARLIAEEKRKPMTGLLVTCIIPILSVTVLTQTRSNFLALLVIFPVLLYKRWKLLVVAILILVAIIVATPVRNRIKMKIDSSAHHRISLAMIAVEVVKDHPITGTGFGIETIANHDLISPEVYNQRVPESYRLYGKHFYVPHNMFLSVAVRTGIVGFVLFGSILGVCLVMQIDLIRHGRTPFIRKWALCMLAAWMMFFVKGNLEPIFSRIPETIFFLILSITAVLWQMDKIESATAEAASQPVNR